jgi:hypothetical protein
MPPVLLNVTQSSNSRSPPNLLEYAASRRAQLPSGRSDEAFTHIAVIRRLANNWLYSTVGGRTT